MAVTKQDDQMRKISPQPGFQEMALSTSADIAIMGGSAGLGKTYVLLMEPLRHISVDGFGGVIFRRNSPQIRNEGGLWDTSAQLYPLVGAEPIQSMLEWKFKKGVKIKFGHLEYDKSVHDWQGSQIPFIGFDELSHFCLTPDTDALTKTGWKKICDIKPGEYVLSYNKDRKAEYKLVQETYAFHYSGKLKCINQRNGVSFKATPNHKAVVMKQLPTHKKTKAERYSAWQFKEVGKIGSSFMPRVADIDSGKEIDWIYFDRPTNRGHGRNSNSIEKMPCDNWLKYLGWFISEGSAYTSNNRSKSPIISIRQTKGQYMDEIVELHKQTGWNWRFREDGNFLIFSRQLFDIVKPWGNAHQKRVPRWIFGLSKRQIRLFFDAFIKGDGHYTKTGGIQIGLCNEGLIDDLHEMSILLGYVARSSKYFTKTGFWVYALNIHIEHRQPYTQTKKEDWYNEDYNGLVHCLRVKDNHTFMIRHDGRQCWTGNSEAQFFYLLSRNRSACGIKPYVRATCNPYPDSWISKLIEWWIGEDGYPIKARNGVLRYFIKDGGNYIWGDTKAEVIEKAWYMIAPQIEASGLHPDNYVKSITFISGSIYDNKELLKVDPGYLANLNALDPQEKSMLLDGNWKVVISENEIYDYSAFIGMFDNVYQVDRKNKYITADIAMEGSDKFVVGAWEGDELVDVAIMDKSNGKEVVDTIINFAKRYHVANRNIIYDSDGVGSFIGGFIPGSQAFNNNGSVIGGENYQNLKTQCFYRSAKKVNDGLVRVSEYAANKMYDNKMTVRQRLIHERKAIKKDKMDMERKLQIIPKAQMKNYLDGQSPDMMDMFMMRSYFDLVPERKIVTF